MSTDRANTQDVQYFSLRWNNHPSNLVSVFSGLYSSESLVDVTLAAEGKHLLAHKVLLSACSEYFQDLFAVTPCKHPIVILKDVTFEDLQTLVHFMYQGVVNVSSDKLPNVLKTADMLRIKGLGEKFSESLNELVCKNTNTVNNPHLSPFGLMSSSSTRLLSVPSQHSLGSLHGLRQRSTESLPDFILRGEGMSSRSVPSQINNKQRRGSASYEHREEVGHQDRETFETRSLSPSRQSSSSTDGGNTNPTLTLPTKTTNPSSGHVVAKKKRELFSARSSLSSSRSSTSHRSLETKRHSSSSSIQSNSQDECPSTKNLTTAKICPGINVTTVTRSGGTMTLPVPPLLIPSTRTFIGAQPEARTESTPVDLVHNDSTNKLGSKRARVLRRQDCLGIELASTESVNHNSLIAQESSGAIKSRPSCQSTSSKHTINPLITSLHPSDDSLKSPKSYDDSISLKTEAMETSRLCGNQDERPRLPSVLVTEVDPQPDEHHIPTRLGVGVDRAHLGSAPEQTDGAYPSFGHCPKAREGPALGCNYCWNTTDGSGRILRRKTKYHCPECQANLCIVPCFQLFHQALEQNGEGKKRQCKEDNLVH